MAGKGIQNPFGELPQPLAEEELTNLVVKLRERRITAEEVKKLFMSHVRLGIKIATTQTWRVENLENDIVQVSMLAIAKAIVLAVDRLHDNNITPYIASRIKGEIINYCHRQSNVVPQRTLSRKKKDDTLYQAVKLRFLDFQSVLANEKSFLPWKTKIEEKLGRLADESNQVWEHIEDSINQDQNLRRREYKRQIIRLKAEGYSTEEISEILDMGLSTVKEMLLEVKKKYFSDRKRKK